MPKSKPIRFARLLLLTMIGSVTLATTCDGPGIVRGCVGMNGDVIREIGSGQARQGCPAMNAWAKEESRACGGLWGR